MSDPWESALDVVRNQQARHNDFASKGGVVDGGDPEHNHEWPALCGHFGGPRIYGFTYTCRCGAILTYTYVRDEYRYP
jgi:hypothetical protein